MFLVGLEMQEWLLIHSEMVNLQRVTYAILGFGFTVAGALGTLALTQTADAEPRGLLLLAGSAVLLVVSLSTLGFFNAFVIAVRGQEDLGRDIAARAHELVGGEPSKLMAYIERVGDVDRDASSPRWLISYGAMGLPGFALVIVAVLLAAAGAWLAFSGPQQAPVAAIVLTVVNGSLMASLGAATLLSVRRRGTW